ncbi:MAG: hypothetical protein NT018_04095 [Armatimonadetes bacterium]|nr:hypothetical protein [Armatimonadota bacterium]
MLDIYDIAARLENDEHLEITYEVAVRSRDGQIVQETRQSRLLDVAEESGLYYVSHKGHIIWVKANEVLKINPL